MFRGTGIIPFLLVGKYNPEEVVALEIQNDMADMAERSVKLNSLEDKIKVYSRDLKDIDFLKSIGRFDVLTVNPPYKINNGGIVNPSDKLAIARHEVSVL